MCAFVSVYILPYSQRPNGVQTSVLVLDHLGVSLQEIEALLRLKTFQIEYELQRDLREIFNYSILFKIYIYEGWLMAITCFKNL